MTAKPTGGVPTWNTGGSNRVAPSAGKRITGWTLGEKPPSGYLNYDQNLIGEWLTWLDGLKSSNVSSAALLSATGAWDFANHYWMSSGAGSAVCAFQIPEDSYLVALKYAAYGDGAVDITNIEVRVIHQSGSTAVAGSGTLTNPAATWQQNTVGLAGADVDEDDTAIVKIDYNGANLRIGNLRLHYQPK